MTRRVFTFILHFRGIATAGLLAMYKVVFVRTGLNRLFSIRQLAPAALANWVRQEERKRSVFSRWRTTSDDQDLVRLHQQFRDMLALLRQREPHHDLGDYLEFGVYRGTQLAIMHSVIDELGLKGMRLFGFDSFEGLPDSAKHEDGGKWATADLRCDYELAREYLTLKRVDWRRVNLVKGWFSDVLTPELRDRYTLCKASCIMIDCDLYSSAKTALEFCAPLIHENCVIFFDEYFHQGDEYRGHTIGEERALAEFVAEHPEFAIEPVGQYSTDSLIVFVRRDPAPASNSGFSGRTATEKIREWAAQRMRNPTAATGFTTTRSA